ncbi:MAG: TylF/MycF/NovP-related O-methyltransferase [Thermodesulfobacteriota bacterium]|nr:TylF/MycF/NovP-related O-methyltransferase [Thermodesulfobacteriota bacterium]
MNEKVTAPQTSVPKSESQGATLQRDVSVWARLDKVIRDHGHDFKHVLELWPAYVRRLHLGRFLAHYELFKHTLDLPGCIVELGVYRGPSFLTWAKLMETFCPGDRKRLVYGFDSFQGLQDFDEKDGRPDPDRGKHVGGYSPGAVREEVEELVDIANQDGFIPVSPRCKLIVGNIEETLPKFLEENSGLRISLLHFDVDLYRPTMVGLELLYPLVVKGGVVILDEYGLVPWQGESNAVDEYFKKIGEQPTIKKFEYSTQPHGYFIK